MVIGLDCVFGWKIREWVGVKIEVLNFGAIIYLLQGFDALQQKIRFTESLKYMCDKGLMADEKFGIDKSKAEMVLWF